MVLLNLNILEPDKKSELGSCFEIRRGHSELLLAQS